MSAKPKAESKAKKPLHSLSIEVRKDEDPATKVAQTLLQPAVQAAMIVWGYGQDNLDVDAVVSELTNQAQAANGGDLSRAEAMLIAQAHALDAIFARLAVLAAPRAGRSLEACETYLRLALKAQSQCRATLETLGALKNPSPALFVRQQNIGVNQQVNNRALDASAKQPISAQAPELLELDHGQRLDAAATGAPSKADPTMAPVGKINGAQNKARQGKG